MTVRITFLFICLLGFACRQPGAASPRGSIATPTPEYAPVDTQFLSHMERRIGDYRVTIWRPASVTAAAFERYPAYGHATLSRAVVSLLEIPNGARTRDLR